MIGLKELNALLVENETKIAELQAENRVFCKLIAIEKANAVEEAQPCEETEEVYQEQIVLQDENC